MAESHSYRYLVVAHDHFTTPMPPTVGLVTVTTLSQVEAPAGQTVSAFALAPSSEQLPPPPPTPEIPKSLEEPTGTPQTSDDVMTSGNKFVPGETAAQQSVDNSPATNSPATQTAPPSTPATGGASPAEAGGVTGGGGETSPSNNESGGTSSEGGTTP